MMMVVLILLILMTGCKVGAVESESTHFPLMWPVFISRRRRHTGLSLLLVLSLAPRGFSSSTPVFPSPQEPTRPNSNSIWNARTHLIEV